MGTLYLYATVITLLIAVDAWFFLKKNPQQAKQFEIDEVQQRARERNVIVSKPP